MASRPLILYHCRLRTPGQLSPHQPAFIPDAGEDFIFLAASPKTLPINRTAWPRNRKHKRILGYGTDILARRANATAAVFETPSTGQCNFPKNDFAHE